MISCGSCCWWCQSVYVCMCSLILAAVVVLLVIVHSLIALPHLCVSEERENGLLLAVCVPDARCECESKVCMPPMQRETAGCGPLTTNLPCLHSPKELQDCHITIFMTACSLCLSFVCTLMFTPLLFSSSPAAVAKAGVAMA